MSRPAASTNAAVALAVCGSLQAARVFVPSVSAGVGVGKTAFRGAAAAEANTSRQASVQELLGLKATTGALALGAGAHLARRSRRSRKSAAAAAAASAVGAPVAAVPAAEAEEEAAPPPPPPFDPAAQLGVTAPLGFFDPLNFTKKGDEDGFRKLRIAEVKHGRVAMMAAVGAVVQHYVQFPGFDKVPKGLGAVLTPPGLYGFGALFLLSGALELLFWKDDPAKEVSDIGNYGNPLQLGIGAPLGESEDMKNRELNNGRAAMFAALGIIVAELATGKDAVEQLG